MYNILELEFVIWLGLALAHEAKFPLIQKPKHDQKIFYPTINRSIKLA